MIQPNAPTSLAPVPSIYPTLPPFLEGPSLSPQKVCSLIEAIVGEFGLQLAHKPFTLRKLKKN